MKFALLTHLPWPEGVDPRRIVECAIEEIQLAEELGFHSAWLTEHHFSRYGLGSSPMVLVSTMAAHTKTIRLGTAVIIPNLHSPVKVAEETALVDLVSGGRLDVGLGRGSADYEFFDYDVDQNESQERFRESVGIIKGLWTTQDYSNEGRFYNVRHANLVPQPVQKPHPPIYIAATRTPATLEFAVSGGHPILMGPTIDTATALEWCHGYETMSLQAGQTEPMSRIPFFRYCYVAETEEQAREDTKAALRWSLDMIEWRKTFKEGGEVNHRIEDWRKSRTSTPESLDHVYEKRAVIGTPEQCVAKIKELREHGIEYFGCNFAYGGMDHAKLMRSMELFAKEVMPHFVN